MPPPNLVVQAKIDKQWKQNVKNDEIILVFQIGGGYTGTSKLPEILEEIPPARSAQSPNLSYFDPEPCTYLDCSGLKAFPDSNPTQDINLFSSLLILGKHLDQVKYAKILFVVKHDFLNKAPYNTNWRSSFFSCPAIQILSKLSKFEHISFGLVVIKQKSKQFKQTTAPSSSQPTVPALRGELLSKLKSARNELIDEKDTCTLEGLALLQNQLQLNFFNAFIRTENVLVIEQDRFWNDKIETLVHLPSPPGFKIAKFCQRKLLFSRQFTTKLFGKTVQSYGNGEKYVSIHKSFISHYKDEIIIREEMVLRTIIGHLLIEIDARPRRKSLMELSRRIINLLASSSDSTGLDGHNSLIEAISETCGWPLENSFITDIKINQEQIQLVSKMSTVLIPVDCFLMIDNQTKPADHPKFFEALKQEVVPLLTKNMLQERNRVCTMLQNRYKSIVKAFALLVDKHLPHNTEGNKKTIEESISMLQKSLNLLKKFQDGKYSNSQLNAYKILSKENSLEVMTNFEMEELEALETHHKNLDNDLIILQRRYKSCENHDASKISKVLENNFFEIKSALIRCQELESKLVAGMKSFTQSCLAYLQETDIFMDLSSNNLEEKITKIRSLIELIQNRQTKYLQSCHENIRITDEMDSISKLLTGEFACPKVKLTMREVDMELDSFLKNHPKLKISKLSFLRKCTFQLSSLSVELTNRSRCLDSILLLNKFLEEYEYHAKPKASNLTNSPLKTDDPFQLLKEILPISKFQDCTNLKTFAWPELISLTKKMITHSRNKLKIEYENGCLIVTGNYVKFSDFCYLKELQSKEMKEIRILVQKILFIDTDLYDQLHRELEIIVIAPRVEIPKKVKITLNGKKGNSYSFPAPNGLQHDDSGRGQKGEDGLPGMPGGNAGNFYLICNDMTNGQNLSVTCAGGNGGDGQNGGNGLNSKWGRPANLGDLIDGYGMSEGQPGSVGGDGGHGGRGGHPGYGGSVDVEVLGTLDYPVISSKDHGTWGRNGLGGRGGQGGKNGDGFKRERWRLFRGITETVIPCDTYEPNGISGREGYNTRGQIIPQRKMKLNSVGKAISEFRFHAMIQNSNDESTSSKQLLKKIDGDKKLLHWMPPHILAKDLLKLELYSVTGKDLHVIFEHETFQNRISQYFTYILANKTGLHSKQESQILQILYAFSLSKVLLLKEHSKNGGVQVVNLQSYFDVISETINRLKSSYVDINRHQALRSYHDHLQSKCEDVARIISKTVIPSIQRAEKGVQENMMSCLNEINAMHDLVEDDLKRRHKEYYNNIKKFWTQATFQSVLKTLNSVSETALFFGTMFPGLIWIGGATKITAGLLGNLGNYGPDDPQPNLQLPQNLNIPVTTNLQENVKKRIKETFKQHDLVSTFLQTHSQLQEYFDTHLTNLKKNIVKLQMMLNPRYVDIQAALVDVEGSLILILEELMKCKDAFPEILLDLHHLLLQLNISSCNADLKINNRLQDLMRCTVDDAGIKVADQQLRNILHRQKSIYQMLAPLVSTVIGSLAKSTESKFATLSEGERKAQKWQVQNTLKNLKEKMADFVKDFKAEHQMMQSIQNFEEAISLLIDLYDMNEKYQESKIFAETLHAMTTQNGFGLSGKISDPELKETIGKIDYQLRANIFLLDYNEAFTAFKQWIFPFANKYLQSPASKLILLENPLENDEQIQNLASEYIRKFEDLKIHLGRYKAMTMDFDSVVFTGKFSKPSKTNPPFFVWNWKMWGNEIRKLLDGEEVDFRADVWEASNLDKGRRGAVKFKSVELSFKHRKGLHSWQQKKINKILEDNFTITMIHGGISYYRVFSKCFVMRGGKQEFCYSFDKSTRNLAHDKISSDGDYLLSPYTNWRFKLNDVKGGGVEKLKKFKGQISLELQGNGWYLDEIKAQEKGLDKEYLQNLESHYELASC